MSKIIVTTQSDWDALPKRFETFTVLEIRSEDTIVIKDNPDSSSAVLWGSSSAELWGSSSAELRDSSSAVLWGSSSAVLWGSSSAELWDSSSAEYEGEQLLQYLEISPLGSFLSLLRVYITTSKTTIRTGCLCGNVEEFAAAVIRTHGDNTHAADYIAAISMIRAIEKTRGVVR